jgi:hypothetical protein
MLCVSMLTGGGPERTMSHMILTPYLEMARDQWNCVADLLGHGSGE